MTLDTDAIRNATKFLNDRVDGRGPNNTDIEDLSNIIYQLCDQLDEAWQAVAVLELDRVDQKVVAATGTIEAIQHMNEEQFAEALGGAIIASGVTTREALHIYQTRQSQIRSKEK